MRKWRVEDSLELYNVPGWGIDYFSINDEGNVVVTPRKSKTAGIDMLKLIDEVGLKEMSTPVLLRFSDILDDRIEMITGCFDKAAREYGYNGKYYCVYPIKVNQQRPVVEELVSQEDVDVLR